jgi:hypothetical protein
VTGQTSHSLIWFTRLSFRWYFTDAHLHNPLPSEEKVKEDHFVHFLRLAMTFFGISNYHLYQQSIHYFKIHQSEVNARTTAVHFSFYWHHRALLEAALSTSCESLSDATRFV